MKYRFGLVIAAVSLVLAGCAAPQGQLAMSPKVIESKATRIGVMVGAMPKVDTRFPGADCLLCMAAASVANSAMTKHVQALPADDLPKLKSELAELLRKKGLDVTVIDEMPKLNDLPDFSGSAPDFASKDFSAIQKKYNIDKLVVIDVSAVGFSRTYASYFPTGVPQGVVIARGYVINLKNHAYEWYLPVYEARSASGQWDEAPSFPGLTNAYYQAIEGARDRFIKPFAN